MAGTVRGTSRALSEEVAFDRAKVTSVDWTSYPILDITEAPEAVDIVLIQPPRASACQRRRDLDPPGRRRPRQRRLRRDRRAPPPRPADPAAAKTSVGVKRDGIAFFSRWANLIPPAFRPCATQRDTWLRIRGGSSVPRKIRRSIGRCLNNHR